MEFPQNRRDRIVMGLSICALILLMANVATFIKHKFFNKHIEHAMVIHQDHQDHDAMLHVEGDDDRHVWHIRHGGQGNNVWVVSGTHQDDCDEEHVHERFSSHEMVFEGDPERIRRRLKERLRRHEHFAIESAEMAQRLSEYREALSVYSTDGEVTIDLDLDLDDFPQLQEFELSGDNVEVIESQDEAGRHSYRIVVKPDDN